MALTRKNWREKKLRKAFSFLARIKLKNKQMLALAYCSTSYLFYGINNRNWREKKLYERLSLLARCGIQRPWRPAGEAGAPEPHHERGLGPRIQAGPLPQPM